MYTLAVYAPKYPLVAYSNTFLPGKKEREKKNRGGFRFRLSWIGSARALFSRLLILFEAIVMFVDFCLLVLTPDPQFTA